LELLLPSVEAGPNARESHADSSYGLLPTGERDYTTIGFEWQVAIDVASVCRSFRE
jgi:hypothetical protein